MSGHDELDDLVRDKYPAEDAALASLVDSIRRLGRGAPPQASPALAAFLAGAEGAARLTDQGHRPAIAGGNIPLPSAPAAGLRKRRHRMKEIVWAGLRTLARLSLVTKIALGGGAVALAGAGSVGAVSGLSDGSPPPVVAPVTIPADGSEGEGADASTDSAEEVTAPEQQPEKPAADHTSRSHQSAPTSGDETSDPSDDDSDDDSDNDSDDDGDEQGDDNDEQGEDSDDDSDDSDAGDDSDEHGDDQGDDNDDQGEDSSDDETDDSDEHGDDQGDD